MSFCDDDDESFQTVLTNSESYENEDKEDLAINLFTEAFQYLSVDTKPNTLQHQRPKARKLKRHIGSSSDSENAQTDNSVISVHSSPLLQTGNKMSTKISNKYISSQATQNENDSFDSYLNNQTNEYVFDSFLVADDDSDSVASSSLYSHESVIVIDFSSSSDEEIIGQEEEVIDNDENSNLSFCNNDVQNDESYSNRPAGLRELQSLVPILVKKFSTKIFRNQLDSLQVTWNPRLLTTAGISHLSTKDGIRCAEISLSTKVLDRVSRLETTLVHEMCHVAAWLIDGVNKPPHGKVFKRWAHLASKHLHVPVTTRHSFHVYKPYLLSCQCCGHGERRHSKKKVTCPNCENGRLVSNSNKNKPLTGFALHVQNEYKNVRATVVNHASAMEILSQQWKLLKT